LLFVSLYKELFCPLIRELRSLDRDHFWRNSRLKIIMSFCHACCKDLPWGTQSARASHVNDLPAFIHGVGDITASVCTRYRVQGQILSRPYAKRFE